MAQNTYSYHLKNGKTLDLEGSEPPSDDEVEAIAKENGVELLPNDTPTPTPKTEVSKTEAPKVNIEPPPSRAEQMYRSVFEAPEFITKPAKEASDYITTPSDEDESYLGGVKARAKGFLGGAIEGASHLLSPANAILSMIPGGSTLSKIAGGALGGAQVLHGAHEISEGNTWGGIGDISMGTLGALVPHVVEPRVNMPSPINETPRGPVLPADVDNQAAILEAIKKPIVDVDRPQGPWEGNIDLTTKPVGLSEDKLFDLAREKQNMGLDIPPELANENILSPTKSKSSNELNLTPEESQKIQSNLDKPVVKNEPEYVQDMLEYTSSGTPGLSVNDMNPSITDKKRFQNIWEIAYRDSEGNPVAVARIVTHPNGDSYIKDFVGDKTKGLLYGRAVKAVGNKLREMNALEADTTLSPDAVNLINKLNPSKPTAEYIGMQPTGVGDETTPLFNIKGGPKDRSTVTLDTLKELGIEPPVIPEEGVKLSGEEIRAKAIKRGQERMDAKNKGFKGIVPDESVVDGGDTIPPPPNEPPTNRGEPPQEDPIKKVQNYTEAAKLVSEPQKKNLWNEVRDAQRALLTSFDFSAPGRQGKGLITHPEYWKSLDDMVAAWGSQRAADAIDESIVNHPSGYFKPTVDPTGKVGPSFAERAGLKIDPKRNEELFKSNIAEKYIPLVARSARAYKAFLGKLRADVFAKYMDQAKSERRDLTNNLVEARKIADAINISSGSGNFGRLEHPQIDPVTGQMRSSTAMKALNEAFFAPHLMKSRVDMYTRVLNPKTYTNTDPIVRKEAWRSLLGVMGTAFLTQELARQIGAQISNDPTNSDFRKIKIGTSRIDNMAGLQQYGVGTARFLLGKSTSSTSGKTQDLTAGKYRQQTREDVLLNFASNKLAPVPSLLVAWMRGKEFDGMPFEIKRAIAMRTAPIVMQDLKELYDSDPSQFPEGFMRENPWITKGAMGLMPIMGEGLQTYGR